MSKHSKANSAKVKTKQKGTSKFVKWFKGLGVKQAGVLIGGIVISLAILISSLTSVIVFSVSQVKSEKIAFANSQKTSTVVGYSAQYLGTVARNIPTETKNEGFIYDATKLNGDAAVSKTLANSLSGYPKYGSNIGGRLTINQRAALIKENAYLCTSNTSHNSGGSSAPYNAMDENGYLYYVNNAGVKSKVLDSNGNQRQLYKHTAAVGNYLGNVSDNESAVVKKITYRSRDYGYFITGLYAPAGEVVKVEISAADMNTTGGIRIYTGQALYNSQANNIWAEKGTMNRMPVLLNTFELNKNTTTYNPETNTYVGYVGNFLGGPIYVMHESCTFSVTISGAVNYSHFILGYTTPEEFNYVSASSAPMFDLEVWDRGVLLSGPNYYSKKFSYDQLYNAAVLWDKIANVSTRNGRQSGIVFLFDPFVAAGAAVAFPGRDSVNCPASWMPDTLNYDAFVKSGTWGNVHEYNHNFQNYGVGYTGEVTNNALNIVEYSLFTKISASRQTGNYGAAGLSGWNRYTSAPWALRQVDTGSITSTNGLAVYATLMHNFGQEAFINARGNWGVNYFNKWSQLTHYDMSYYAKKTQAYNTFTNDQITAMHNAQSQYPMFIPVSNIYQTGRSYNYTLANGSTEKRYITTMQPYVIRAGEEFTLDLSRYSVNSDGGYRSGSMVLPTGFDYRIVNVTNPSSGTLTKVENSDMLYKYMPSESSINSGKIIVTIELTQAPAGYGIELNDATKYIDIVIEFEQSYELNKWIIERDIYTLSDGVIENNYNNDPIKVLNAINAKDKTATPVQYAIGQNNNVTTKNSSSEIWDPFNLPNNNVTVQAKNTLMVLNGKLYIPSSGDYRFALRCRGYGALQLSFDGGKNYTTVVSISQDSASFNVPQDDTTKNLISLYSKDNPNPKAYIDYNNLTSGSWVYFRAVLIITQSKSYIGVGSGKWTEQGLLVKTDANGRPVTDNDGNLVYDTDDYGNPKIDPNNPPKVNVGYASAYRNNYRSVDAKFKTDYFYTRGYTLTYDKTAAQQGATPKVVSTNYEANSESQTLLNMFDGKNATNMHTKKHVNADNPLEFVIDMGKTIGANSLTMYGNSGQSNNNCSVPITFKLWVSTDGKNFTLVGDYKDLTPSGNSVTVNFDDVAFRYFKMVITQGRGNDLTKAYVCIGELTFRQNIGKGTLIHPDSDKVSYKGGQRWQLVSAESWFGHLYVGQKGATATFTFTGNRFGVISNTNFGFNVEVYIDGNKLPTASVGTQAGVGAYQYAYISPVLSSGTHTVTIKCLDYTAIDSIIYWA